VLLIHGDLDPNTRIDELQKMKNKLKNGMKLWRVAGARHREVDLQDPELYIQRVVGFFEEHMQLN
jgi:dipeptidyl aminopeptidase/acylaminoacyl peptidase